MLTLTVLQALAVTTCKKLHLLSQCLSVGLQADPQAASKSNKKAKQKAKRAAAAKAVAEQEQPHAVLSMSPRSAESSSLEHSRSQADVAGSVSAQVY